MDTSFFTQSYHHFKSLWSGPVAAEGTTESVIPDNMPDIGAVVDCGAILCIRSKECENGRILLSVDVNSRLVYMPEDSAETQSMPIRSSLTVSCAVADADSACLCTADLRIRSLDCRIINSRKISLRIELAGEVECFIREELVIAEGIQKAECTIETQQASSPIWLVSDVAEKTFVVTDDFALPAACTEPSAILSEQVSCRVDEVEFVGEKMVFRGRVSCFFLLKDEGSVYPCVYESEFSQIAEVKCSEDSLPDIRLLLTGAYFDLPDRAGGKLNAEIHVLAQIVSKSKYNISYISDAYSNQLPIEPCFVTQNLCVGCDRIKLRNNVRDSIDNTRDIKTVLYSCGSVISSFYEQGSLKLSLGLKIVYIGEDGRLASVNYRIQSEIETETGEEQSAKLSELLLETPITAVSNNSIEVRIPLEISIVVNTIVSMNRADGFKLSEAAPECPSLTLLNCADDSELWTLAKTHHSSIEAILAANEGRSTGLLLIPKCR